MGGVLEGKGICVFELWLHKVLSGSFASRMYVANILQTRNVFCKALGLANVFEQTYYYYHVPSSVLSASFCKKIKSALDEVNTVEIKSGVHTLPNAQLRDPTTRSCQK